MKCKELLSRGPQFGQRWHLPEIGELDASVRIPSLLQYTVLDLCVNANVAKYCAWLIREYECCKILCLTCTQYECCKAYMSRLRCLSGWFHAIFMKYKWHGVNSTYSSHGCHIVPCSKQSYTPSQFHFTLLLLSFVYIVWWDVFYALLVTTLVWCEDGVGI